MKRPSPLTLYRDWKRKDAAVGCVFARYMATKPERFGQRAAVVRGADPATIARRVAAQIATLVADDEAAAATLVLSEVDNLATLARFALALGAEPEWAVRRTVLQDTPIGDVVAFNIVRDILMHDGNTCPSEALVLGPFSTFPKTRRAPVTALEMFVGLAPTNQRDGKPTLKAHLADVMIDGLRTPGVFNSMWKQTQSERLRSLGGIDDPRAKAKVSFVISMAVARSIGCVP
jgi:hypothetical protein